MFERLLVVKQYGSEWTPPWIPINCCGVLLIFLSWLLCCIVCCHSRRGYLRYLESFIPHKYFFEENCRDQLLLVIWSKMTIADSFKPQWEIVWKFDLKNKTSPFVGVLSLHARSGKTDGELMWSGWRRARILGMMRWQMFVRRRLYDRNLFPQIRSNSSLSEILDHGSPFDDTASILKSTRFEEGSLTTSIVVYSYIN